MNSHLKDKNAHLPAYEKALAPYACFSSHSRGRLFPEKCHPYRSEFQRDRERIIHSKAFRRLEYKTQVFINHEGDHYRTRLTHTIEVAQIARTTARALGLNEDLSEAIALAHDLGHTPFGHSGERQLNLLMKDHGGFEHNRQTLRVVEELEKTYQNYNGLNLTWETREGIIKHSTPDCGESFSSFAPGVPPTLEAQIISPADEIAYNSHDLDDGISSGLLSLNEIAELEIWLLASAKCSSQVHPDSKLLTREIIRMIINLLVTDLIETTSVAISDNSIKSLLDVTNCGKTLAGFSSEVHRANSELKSFLQTRLYRHYKVKRMSMKAENVIRDLFSIYTRYPDILPDEYRSRAVSVNTYLVCADYIAGMTDRFALEEHKRLTDPMIGV